MTWTGNDLNLWIVVAGMVMGFALCLLGIKIGFKMGRETQGHTEAKQFDPGPQPKVEIIGDPYDYDLGVGKPTA